MSKIKAISLMSGGLDSMLAARLILDQGIEVEAVYFSIVFCNNVKSGTVPASVEFAAKQLGIKLKVFEISKEYFDIIKNPKYGYGRNANPCLDCHIYMIKKAGEYMKTQGASFVITGEVLGERPMSQRREALAIVDRDTGLRGYILRPLSAKALEPTIAEKEGLVDREKLFDIKGRSRKPQIQLAKDLGINKYPAPAGGCLLTDPCFSVKMKDLLEKDPGFSLDDVKLLKSGRHFRLGPATKLVVGRNEAENKRLMTLLLEQDLCFYAVDATGPIAIGRGEYDADAISLAASIVARYSDIAPGCRPEIAYKAGQDKPAGRVAVTPATEDVLNNLRI